MVWVLCSAGQQGIYIEVGWPHQAEYVTVKYQFQPQLSGVEGELPVASSQRAVRGKTFGCNYMQDV